MSEFKTETPEEKVNRNARTVRLETEIQEYKKLLTDLSERVQRGVTTLSSENSAAKGHLENILHAIRKEKFTQFYEDH